MTATVLLISAFIMSFCAIYAVLNFSKEMQKYNKQLAENSFELQVISKKISAIKDKTSVDDELSMKRIVDQSNYVYKQTMHSVDKIDTLMEESKQRTKGLASIDKKQVYLNDLFYAYQHNTDYIIKISEKLEKLLNSNSKELVIINNNLGLVDTFVRVTNTELKEYNEQLANNSFEVERLVKKISAMRANQEKEIKQLNKDLNTENKEIISLNQQIYELEQKNIKDNNAH